MRFVIWVGFNWNWIGLVFWIGIGFSPFHSLEGSDVNYMFGENPYTIGMMTYTSKREKTTLLMDLVLTS